MAKMTEQMEARRRPDAGDMGGDVARRWGLLVPAGVFDSGGAAPYRGPYPPRGAIFQDRLGCWCLSRGGEPRGWDALYIPAELCPQPENEGSGC